MLTVDSSIRIGMVAIPGEDAYGIGTHAAVNPNESNSLHSGWPPVVLATLKSFGVTPHFMSHHSYAQNPGEESDSVLLQAGATLESDAVNLRKMITDYVGGAAGASIELAVTELNSVNTNPLDHFTPGSATATVFSYGNANDLSGGDLTTGTAAIPGTTFDYTFPSYSMSVLVVKGQYENWREGKFTAAELLNGSFSGDHGQPAHDGIPNLLKYALGLDPKLPATTGLPATGRLPLNGMTYLTLTFTKQRALTDISYAVQVSGDLLNWQSGPLVTARIDDGTSDTATYRDLTAIRDVSPRFIRLNVTRP